jgi:predicted Zn-dependent protease
LQNAIKLDPTDGEAYGYLSRAYSGLGDYNKALVQDNAHVKSHWYERQAFEQRANTLDHLGRTAEARYDRELAEKVYQSTHH